MRTKPVQRSTSLKRAAVLSHYDEVVQKLGLNPQPLLRKVGLTKQMLSVPTHMIPMDSTVALLDLTAQASGCDTVGLMMAEARTLADFGPISLLLVQQPSVRAALQTMAQYRHVLNEALGLYIEDAGKQTIIREEIVTGYEGNATQSSDMAVGVLMVLFRAILGAQWRPQTAHFTRVAPADVQIYKRLFKCALQFESEFNGLVCLTADMDKPNLQADAAMASYAQSFMDALPKPGARSVLQDVRRSVYLLLPMGRASLDQVASGFGMNERTLQRQLDKAGVSFTAILNEVRRELAQRYVENTTYSMGRVAELLGYSNLSSLTRWFTVQFGEAPTRKRV
jgi:AraC-like DNA-binding protein